MPQQKAISPIIAIIIILLITIAIAGAGYSYISTYWSGLVGKEIQVVSSFCIGDNQAKIMVKNIGTNPLRTGEISIINPNTGEDLTRNVAWSSSVTGHVDDPGLVLELMFEEGSGTLAKDTSGKGNDGTLIGDTKWVEGRIGGALSFDGVDDYIESSFTLPTEISVSLWVNFMGSLAGCCDHPFGLGNSDSFTVFYDNSNHIYYKFNNAVQNIFGTYELGKWDHIVVTFDGSDVRGYINRNLGNSVAGTPLYTNNVRIGDTGAPGGKYFNGSIDEVRIYNRALSPDEIAILAGNFQVQPGDTATLTHTCSGRCRYNLVLGGTAKEAMLEC